jgi:hypothetical protein
MSKTEKKQGNRVIQNFKLPVVQIKLGLVQNHRIENRVTSIDRSKSRNRLATPKNVQRQSFSESQDPYKSNLPSKLERKRRTLL